MRSLAFKLTLAFLLVGLMGAALVAILVRYRTQREFDQLVLGQNQQVLLNSLTLFYQENEGWNGVEAAFRFSQDLLNPERFPEMRWEVRRALFIIADADGKVVLGTNPKAPGQKVSNADLKEGTPIEVEGQTVGWLIFTPALDRWRPGTLEGDFLTNVTRAIFTSAIAATGMALILGSFLAYSLTRSLREMTAATQHLAKGNFGFQVKVRTKDELGVLAASFNQMSTELARSTELRQQMTANIAHDLRSPLSVILGYAEALSDKKLEPTPEIFTVVHTEALHLSRLIEDLKTLALADARELPLVPQKVAPQRLLGRALEAFRIQADREGISLKMEAAQDLPEIQVDVERMIQVLGNLMNNALRFTPPGGQIRLSADLMDGNIRMQVADNGEGISPEDLPHIFERSYRGDKARGQQAGETGLGLAIAKSLVEAQGGQIYAESVLGEGTTFTLLLPVSQAAPY